MTDPDESLHAVLRAGQRIGAIGPTPVGEAITHARRFVRALPDGCRRVLDLGSGGGLPGLVIAWDRPELDITLVDRRTKRTDHLERAVRRLNLSGRVTVLNRDVASLSSDPAHAHSYDAITARSFGPPVDTIRAALPLLRPGGSVLISDPPNGDHRDVVVHSGVDVVVERVPTVPGVSIFRARPRST